MTLGNAMIIPALPTIQKTLEISSLQVSMIITVYSLVAIILIPFAGFISDLYGRKVVIIPSLVIAGLGAFVSGYASWQVENPYFLILVGRFLQGIGAAGAFPIVLPLVGDLFKAKEDVSSSLGIIETSNTFGKVLSPVLGGIFAAIVWYLPFFAFVVLTIIPILLMFFFVKAPEKSEHPPKFRLFLKSVVTIFKRDGRWLCSIFAIGCICMFVVYGTLFYLSTILEDQYGFNNIKSGFILAVPLAALSIASFFTGRVIGDNKLLMKWITFFGLALVVIATFIGAFTTTLSPLLATLFFSGLGIGVVLPSLDALVIEGMEKAERGTITSLYSSMRFAGVALGPPVFAIVMKVSDQVLFFTASGVSLTGALVALFAIKPPEK